MHTKLITACMALVVFATLAIVPGTASATNDPTFFDDAGHVPTGTIVIGTPTGLFYFTDTSGSPLVECSKASLSGTITKNSGGTVESEITTFDLSGTGTVAAHSGLNECTGSFGNAWTTVVSNPLCLRSTPTMATDEFQVTSGKCSGGGKVKFIIGSTTVGECEYETTGATKGDYTTGKGTALTVRNTSAGSGASRVRGGFFCPSSVHLKMIFALDTKNGEPIYIS